MDLIFIKSLFLSPLSSWSPHPDSYREEDNEGTKILTLRLKQYANIKRLKQMKNKSDHN
jgi:hypothetical protein